MKRLTLCVLMLLLFGAAPAQADDAPLPLFVLMGQSNMVMAGPDLAPALRAAYPESMMVFAAVGGTSIADWQRGDRIYNAALFATRAAMRLGYEPAAILFQQGEMDARNCRNANEWRDLFWKFAQGFREDIGYPYLPVVYGKLGEEPDGAWPCWGIVRDQQQAALVGHPGFRLFSMWQLGPHVPSDSPHYGEAGYAEMVRRIMVQLVPIVPAVGGAPASVAQ